jgi:hypothetical protein
VLIVAVGLSQGEHSERAGEAPAAAVSTATVGAGTAPLIGGMAEYHREQAEYYRAPTALAPPIRIYLVDTQIQADAVQRDLNDAGVLGAAPGTDPRPASVVLFPSVEAEVQFWAAMGEQERASAGLGPVTIVDLRTRTGAARP